MYVYVRTCRRSAVQDIASYQFRHAFRSFYACIHACVYVYIRMHHSSEKNCVYLAGWPCHHHWSCWLWLSICSKRKLFLTRICIKERRTRRRGWWCRTRHCRELQHKTLAFVHVHFYVYVYTYIHVYICVCVYGNMGLCKAYSIDDLYDCSSRNCRVVRAYASVHACMHVGKRRNDCLILIMREWPLCACVCVRACVSCAYDDLQIRLMYFRKFQSLICFAHTSPYKWMAIMLHVLLLVCRISKSTFFLHQLRATWRRDRFDRTLRSSWVSKVFFADEVAMAIPWMSAPHFWKQRMYYQGPCTCACSKKAP